MSAPLLFLLQLITLGFIHCKVIPEIRCSRNSLDLRVRRVGVERVGLGKWEEVPGCGTALDRQYFLISFKLESSHRCGITKIENKLTGESLYYHKVILVESDGSEYTYKVSCLVSSDDRERSNIVKRNVLPAEFVEPEFIEITSEVSGTAPIPELTVGVRQNGNLIGSHVTVSPGAPLTMEVYLDSESASTYGILVSYVMVTDTSDKNETIIFNGCTQDRYIFENFQTNDGDYLTAKFRAFKFPESNYLFFKGTVDVCLDRCQGIRCSSGEIGYGRRRRAVSDDGRDQNKMFEVTLMTFIRVADIKLQEKERILIGQDISGGGENPSLSFREREILIDERTTFDGQPPFTMFERSAVSSLSKNLSFVLVALVSSSLYWMLWS